ncbi:hypothetical protein GCM10020256_44410 [Streptomyces thermocoprophilus]
MPVVVTAGASAAVPAGGTVAVPVGGSVAVPAGVAGAPGVRWEPEAAQSGVAAPHWKVAAREQDFWEREFGRRV